MQGYIDFFKDKRITLMGLGLLGRGVGDAEFLAPLCRELIVTDKKTNEELQESKNRLAQFPNITYVLGEHREEDFTDADMVIKAAGVPLDSSHIAAAKKAGVPVYMSTALFAKFAREQGATLVAVTGTRGKSTTAALIHHVLVQAAPRDASGRERKIFLGGNVRGLSTLAMIPGVRGGDVVVLELDSWQLQGFGDLKLSPDIAVFTNLMPDHLNYYAGDLEKYFWDKANIFTHQKAGDKLVVGEQILQKIQQANPPVAPLVPPPIPESWNLKIVGMHNRENAALAALTLRMLGLSDDEIKHGLETFEAVEGRLQFVREVNGVKIYNDNNATTPEATLAALSSFDPSKTILIAGGSDKNLPLELLAEKMRQCKKVFLLAGGGTDKLKILLPDSPIYGTMEEVVRDAFSAAALGDVLLMSPAFASFGMFRNEYDRNDQFMEVVKQLQ
ncbi:UDP-N-acetylmuramoyl-L-alanine--D-glutamate ligase [Patescibacteria group bacterium]|nr:UDP-N-acetylmuramoyl-L-alanine--D-glutamate ligase [Patescibacteria group bacterium]